MNFMSNTTLWVERLRHNVLTELLTDEEFTLFRKECQEHRFEPGEIIHDDQEEGTMLHLIVEGRVRITKALVDGPDTLLALLHIGDFFGELSLIDGRRRSAKVTAVDPTITYSIDRTMFEKMVAGSPTFALRLLQAVSIRLRTVDHHFVSYIDRQREAWTQEVESLRTVIEAAKNLNSTLDLDRLLTVILDTALGAVNGDRGTLYLVDKTKNELWSRTLKGNDEIRLPLGSGIAGYVASTGDTLNIPDAYFDPRFNPDFDRKTGYRTRSILCMPMKNKDGEIIGVFQLLNKRSGAFTAHDEQTLEALSVHAAIALENARLHEQEREKLALEKELLAAREVQMMFLPKHLPEIPGYEFAAVSVPAREVGGDLYDFIQRKKTELAFTLGDVSGKGLPASLLMANTQATIRDQSLLNDEASACISRANKLLYESTGAEKFVTLFYAVLHTEDGSLAYCNAGHERPFLISRDGAVHRLDRGGTVLGILPDYPYVEGKRVLLTGETCVVFSDGIPEAVNAKEEQFGEARLQETILRCKNLGASKIRDTIIESLRIFVDGTPQADDITLVVVKRKL
jgi:sigma-B regulation protein RsbU (phosphoserine phosphatase)